MDNRFVAPPPLSDGVEEQPDESPKLARREGVDGRIDGRLEKRQMRGEKLHPGNAIRPRRGGGGGADGGGGGRGGARRGDERRGGRPRRSEAEVDRT